MNIQNDWKQRVIKIGKDSFYYNGYASDFKKQEFKFVDTTGMSAEDIINWVKSEEKDL